MRFLLLPFLLFSCPALRASETGTSAPIRLGGPEVARLAWDIRGLVQADFDLDGKLDAALINNENAKLVILYQRVPGSPVLTAGRRAVSRDRWEPSLEDSRFEKVSLPADQRHFTMAAGDFDGDGRQDLAVTGAADALTVRYQGESGGFSKTWTWRNFEPVQWSQTMVAADLNGDGKSDLAVLAKSKLLVFLQQEGGTFGEPVSYLTTEEKAGHLMALDADNDGKLDLIFTAASNEGSLRLRRQTSPGAFGSEIALDYTLPAYGTAPSRNASGQLVLTRVNARSRLIERHTLDMKAPGAVQNDKLLPTLHAPPGGVKNALHAIGDFDGDGLQDVAQADGKSAAVSLFLQQADGSFAEPRTFPSLSGINGLAAVQPVQGQAHMIVVTSAREGVGFSRLSPEGRLGFPELQTIEGPPAGVTAVKQADGSSLPVVVAGKDRLWSLHLLSPDGKTAWTTNTQPLKGLTREPAGVCSGDLNGDGRDDLLVLPGKDTGLILIAKTDGPGFGEPLAETASLKSQLSGLAPENVALIDIDADKRAEILTAATGYARTLRLNPAGTDIEIVDQCNARTADDKLSVPVFADADADGKMDLLFQEAGSAFWQVLEKDQAGVWRSTTRLQADSSETAAAFGLPLGKEAKPHLMAFGRDRFWTAPLSGSRPALTLTASYETDLKNCQYYMVVPADLNHDGNEELAAFDQRSKLLEVLKPGGVTGDGWQSLLHFILFEENIHFRGRKGAENVSEVLTGDFTGDGRNDLLVLVHDRVLLYPQE